MKNQAAKPADIDKLYTSQLLGLCSAGLLSASGAAALGAGLLAERSFALAEVPASIADLSDGLRVAAAA